MTKPNHISRAEAKCILREVYGKEEIRVLTKYHDGWFEVFIDQCECELVDYLSLDSYKKWVPKYNLYHFKAVGIFNMLDY